MKNKKKTTGGPKKYSLFLPCFLGGLFLTPSAMASGLVLGMELSSGGDEIARLSDGESVKAGELLYFGAGYDFTLNRDDTLRLRTMLGYKFVHLNASNGDVKFNRAPLDVALIKRTGSFSFGGGLSYHLSPTYDGTVNGANTRINFDDSLGYALQGSYNFGQKTELGIRLLSIDYKANQSFVMPDGSVTKKLNGNSAGIYLMVGL